MLNTQPKQLLGYLPVDFVLPVPSNDGRGDGVGASNFEKRAAIYARVNGS